VASTRDELINTLNDWCDKGASSLIKTGQLSDNSKKYEPAMERLGNQHILSSQSYESDNELFDNLLVIAELYTQGYRLAYENLFDPAFYSRVSLPTYPFLEDRYWVEGASVAGVSDQRARLHPLLHENTSTVYQTGFSSQFNGSEFYFSDHQVGGVKVLPGVGHLEMAHQAIRHASGDAVNATHRALSLTDVVWLRPVAMQDESVSLQISVLPQEDDEFAYDIYSVDAQGQDVVYSQGSGHWCEPNPAEVLDIATLRAQCALKSLSAAQVYADFTRHGLQYGAGHQGLVSLAIGEDARGLPQVLGELSLPPGLRSDASDYTLHPSIMDSALQASIGLLSAVSLGPRLPFTLSSLRIDGPTPERG
jgi:acyl transferase domain-containing protein